MWVCGSRAPRLLERKKTSFLPTSRGRRHGKSAGTLTWEVCGHLEGIAVGFLQGTTWYYSTTSKRLDGISTRKRWFKMSIAYSSPSPGSAVGLKSLVLMLVRPGSGWSILPPSRNCFGRLKRVRSPNKLVYPARVLQYL